MSVPSTPSTPSELLAAVREIASDDDALLVACPYCQALPGVACHNRITRDITVTPHLGRRDRAAAHLEARRRDLAAATPAPSRLDDAIAEARLTLQRHADSGDIRPSESARELAQALGGLVRALQVPR